MKVTFNMTEYAFSHGHAPRGRGNWAFKFARDAEIGDYFFAESMLYSDAKKAAAAEEEEEEEEKRRGASVAYVCA